MMRAQATQAQMTRELTLYLNLSLHKPSPSSCKLLCLVETLKNETSSPFWATPIATRPLINDLPLSAVLH